MLQTDSNVLLQATEACATVLNEFLGLFQDYVMSFPWLYE